MEGVLCGGMWWRIYFVLFAGTISKEEWKVFVTVWEVLHNTRHILVMVTCIYRIIYVEPSHHSN